MSRMIFRWILLATAVSAVSTRYVTFDALVERIEQLEERDRLQQKEINTLKQRDLIQTERIAQLEERDRLQKDELDRLRESVLSQKDEIVDLRKQLHIKNTNTPPLDPYIRKNERTEPKERQIRNPTDTKPVGKFDQGKPIDRSSRAENEMEVTFFATLTSHQIHVGVNQAILFDHVITNIGNAYRSTLGSFIAPVSGTYVFSTSLLTWAKDTHYSISKNGNVVSNIYCKASLSGYESTSQTVVLTLNQNDDITIRGQDADGQTHGSHYSTFAGFLLQQHYQNAIVG